MLPVLPEQRVGKENLYLDWLSIMLSYTIFTEGLSKVPESEMHLSRISVSYYLFLASGNQLMDWKTNIKNFSWVSHMEVEYLGRNKQLKISLGDLPH